MLAGLTNSASKPFELDNTAEGLFLVSSLYRTLFHRPYQLPTLDQRSYSTQGPVSARMGDRLRAGKLSRYVTSHPGQLSLAIPLWVGQWVPA